MVDRDDTVPSLPVGTPGALIRQAREQRGLSLEVLFQETRIPVRLLAAIENDDYDQLSGPLYARSFLRTLARTLQLDEQQLLQLYERLLKEDEPTVPADQTWEEEVAVERIGLLAGVGRRRLLTGLAALGAVVLLLWLGLHLHARRGAGPTDTTTVARTGEQVPAPVETPSSQAVGGDTLAATDTVTVATGWAPAVSLPDSAAVESLLVRPDPAELARLSALPDGTPDLEFAGGRHFPYVLRVVVRERCDLAVAVDAQSRPVPADWSRSDRPGLPHSGIVPGRVYAAGRRFVVYWGAEDHFIVRLGAADGVTLTVNGRALVVSRQRIGREWFLDARFLAGP